MKHINVTNSDGNLVCDWVKQPPPQVGEMAYNPTLSNRKPERNCRILPSVTFFAPQYMVRGDPIAVQALPPGK